MAHSDAQVIIKFLDIEKNATEIESYLAPKNLLWSNFPSLRYTRKVDFNVLSMSFRGRDETLLKSFKHYQRNFHIVRLNVLDGNESVVFNLKHQLQHISQ